MAPQVRGHDSLRQMPISAPQFLIEAADVNLDEHSGWTYFGLEPGPYVTLGVSDTGRGMVAETRAHVIAPSFSSTGRTPSLVEFVAYWMDETEFTT